MEVRNKELFFVFLFEFFLSDRKIKIGGKLMKQIKSKEENVRKFIKKFDKKGSGNESKNGYYNNSSISFRLNLNK